MPTPACKKHPLLPTLLCPGALYLAVVPPQSLQHTIVPLKKSALSHPSQHLVVVQVLVEQKSRFPLPIFVERRNNFPPTPGLEGTEKAQVVHT